jgi:hypothetical protein
MPTSWKEPRRDTGRPGGRPRGCEPFRRRTADPDS